MYPESTYGWSNWALTCLSVWCLVSCVSLSGKRINIQTIAQKAGSICIKIWNWKIHSLWKTHFTKTNWKAFFYFFFGRNWLANMHGFANICKLPVFNTFKNKHSKIWQTAVLLKYFKFCCYMYCKKINL